MAVELPMTEGRPEPFYWWFLPSWLGLDAPCVVLTWTWATSRSSDLPLDPRSAAALFLVVWSIYLSDRLIDVAGCQNWVQATGRLRFGRDCRLLFWACLSVSVTGLLALLWAGLPLDVLWRAAVVALGVVLHILAFVVPVFLRAKLPGKEFGVGLFFALGAWTCLGATTAMIPLFASIATVVAYNCLVIAARDATSDQANDPGGASRWWPTINRDLLWIGTTLSMAAIVWASLARETAFYLAVAAALVALTLLHRYSGRWSGDAVRALADFALFTPIPVLAFMS